MVIKVNDQDKALAFYTTILSFVKMLDIPGSIRRLTVVCAWGGVGAEGVELVFEPNHFPPAPASQKALYDGGFPATIFTTNDISAEYKRLMSLGVKFREESGPVTFAFFDDTCGNLIALNLHGVIAG